ncbi:MAG TPA: acyloxyacyl hydrolase [Myxococcota bacterium]
MLGTAGALLVIFLGPSRADAEDAAFFVLGPQEAGLALGYGQGIEFTGSGEIEGHEVRELIVRPHWQIEVTRRSEAPPWYGGALALRLEGTILANFAPRQGVAAGVGLLLRYNFLHWERATPYLQAGAGVMDLEFDLADQHDGLAFTPEAGAGLCYRLDPDVSVDAGVRFHHISNANSSLPNGGIDSLQFILGLAYHFD